GVSEMSGGVDIVATPPMLPVGSPVTTPPNGEPLTHFFHQSPEHCSVSFAAINKMRQNTQIILRRALKRCRNNSTLKWDSLTDRRTRIRLCAMYKIYRGEPAWGEIKNRLQPPNYSSRNDHSHKLRERRHRTDTGKFYFLNRTIRDWNALPADLLKALPIIKNVFKNRLKDFTNRRYSASSYDERVMERRKFSPAPGFEPGFSALRADALSTKPPDTTPASDKIVSG
ncbi:hypothetical protein ANN_26835, partial [Periplaneta americana]